MSRSRGLRALLSDQQWAALVQSGTRHRYQRGDRLIRQGDPERWILLLVAGRAKVVYSAADGSEVLLAVRGPGDVLGEFAARDEGPRSASVLAIEPCLAHTVAAGTFDQLIRRSGREPEVDRYVMAKLRESTAHTWRLTARAPAAQLAELLTEIVSAAGPEHPDPYEVTMSQEELARALGLARSSITPVLAAWKRAGVIDVSHARVRIRDMGALSAIRRR
ncbi:Crp/Fnr family transcriptional regulator [Actinocatenispora sera]|uniref:Crp/Fnr family transcriptional regulator n=1 Tax=Actinocatenispora sera TaxID=390989 RepID=UPI0033E87A5B